MSANEPSSPSSVTRSRARTPFGVSRCCAEIVAVPSSVGTAIVASPRSSTGTSTGAPSIRISSQRAIGRLVAAKVAPQMARSPAAASAPPGASTPSGRVGLPMLASCTDKPSK